MFALLALELEAESFFECVADSGESGEVVELDTGQSITA